MSPKKAYVMMLRIFFVFSSLQFMRDVFYKWDGYSFYMRFTHFVPDLAFTYIFSAIGAMIFTSALWLGLYIFIRIIPASLNVRFEHTLIWIILCVIVLLAKKIFLNVSLTNLFGVNYFVILVFGSILIASIVWALRSQSDRILNGLNNRISPLVWLFVFLLALAVPLSFSGPLFSEAGKGADDRAVSDAQTAAASDNKRPNIIMVVMDSLTARDMQLYGYERPTTPFISKWAEQSVVFQRTYSSSNWTTPSMMSMMSGQLPWTHRVWYRAYYNPVVKYEDNMARALRENGYDVYGFVQNHYAHPEVLGIGDSFSIQDKSHTFSLTPVTVAGKIRRFFVDRPIVADWVMDVQPIIRAVIKALRVPVYSTLYPPEIVYNRFLDFMRTQQQNSEGPDRPFFALLHVFPPHTWYLPPAPYMGMFGEEHKFNNDIKQEPVTNREYSPDMQNKVDELRLRYDEFILYADSQFGSFMSSLAETVDMSNTIVILTSDHGESFSHGYQEHDGPHLYEQFVHVPFIIHMPGQMRGRMVDASISQIDIAPTILELSGIAAPEFMEGRSVVPLLEGRNLEPRPIFSMQLIKNPSFGHLISKGTVAVWNEDYKLVYYMEDKKTLMFNLRDDPRETMDLSDNEPGIREKLFKLINEKLLYVNAKN